MMRPAADRPRWADVRSVALLVVLLPAMAMAAGGAPAKMPMLAKPPTIDGMIDPAEWKGALVVRDFHETNRALMGEGIPNELRTEAYVAQTDSAFHFAFRSFHDRMRGIVTAATKHDGPVWSDDSVEVFLDAHGTRYSYYHIIANAAGCVTDAFNKAPRRRDATWDADARAAGRVFADRFTVELSVPFHTLNLGLNRKGTIGLNLCRNVRYSIGRQSWRGGFHDPANAALLGMSGAGPERFPVVVESATWGELTGANAVQVRLRNLSGDDMSLAGRLEMAQGSKVTHKPFALQAAPGKAIALDLPYDLAGRGAVRCRLTLRDRGKRVLAVVPRILHPKAVASVTIDTDMVLRSDRPCVRGRLNVPRAELKDYAIEIILRNGAGRVYLKKGPLRSKRPRFQEPLDLSRVPAGVQRLEVRTVLRNVKSGATVMDSRIPLRILPSPWAEAGG